MVRFVEARERRHEEDRGEEPEQERQEKRALEEARLRAGKSFVRGHGRGRYQDTFLAAGLAALAVSLRLVFLPVDPVPIPRIHDEFSYLLAADTFAHGRLTNPTPPAADFLETFHVLVRPTYMSKYPVAQGLVLAAGQILFGHPWWGVLASAGAMCAAVFWALRGWLPRRWALLGGLATALRYGAADYFVDSYWGGAVAAAGGALVFGAAGRLLARAPSRAHSIRTGLVLGFGAAILLHARPWEGFLLCVPFGAALIARASRDGARSDAARSLAVALFPLVFAGAFLLYDAARVTGSPWKLPHRAYSEQYQPASLFLVGGDLPVPPSRHAQLRRTFTEWEPRAYSPKTGRLAADWIGSVARWFRTVRILAGAWGAAIVVVLLSGGRRGRLPVAALAFFTAGIGLQRYQFLHYVAPALALFVALLVAALREAVLRFRRAAPALVRASFVLVAILLGVRAIGNAVSPVAPSASLRRSVEEVLAAERGRHLVAVRYAPDHDVHTEFVFNAADVAGAKIVWLRDPPAAEREGVVSAFPGRRFWVLEPDRSGQLRPYRAP